MNADQPNCLILNAGTDVGFAIGLQNLLSSVAKTAIIHFNQKESREGDSLTTLTLDVVALKDQLANVDYVVYLPRIPAWNERLSDLISTDYHSLGNVLNIALESQVKRLIYISDIEAMGSSLRPVVVNEDSLWSGQTKSNEVQKYWYLCEQEIARAREEGLSATMVAASQMTLMPNEDKVEYYTTDQHQLAQSVRGVMVSDISAFKIFCVEAIDAAALQKSESKVSIFQKWFGSKRKPINKLTIDATHSKALLDKIINQ